jgi:hypothetical protein
MSEKHARSPPLQSRPNAGKKEGIEEGNAPRRKRVASKGARVEISLIVGDFFMAPVFDGPNYQGTVAFEVCRVLTTTHEGRHLVVEVRGGSSAKLVKRVDTLLGEDNGIIHVCSQSECLFRAQEHKDEVINIHVSVIEFTTAEGVELACKAQFAGFSFHYWLGHSDFEPPSEDVESNALPRASSGAASSRSVDATGTRQASSGASLSHESPSSLRLISAMAAKRKKDHSMGAQAVSV